MAVDVQVPERSPLGLRGWLKAIGIEAMPAIVVLFASLIALDHVVKSDWGATFFYGADSIMLPMIEESIQRGDGFGWIFSSQNFFFPEGPLYFLSSLFTDSPRVAMLVNAVLNLLCLYALLRVIAHQLAHHSRHRFVEITIACSAVLLFIIFMLLEPTDSINRSGIATLFLFTTYYYGVVLVGLLVISLTLWLTRLLSQDAWGRGRYITYAVVVGLLTVAVSFSNPLYLVQVIAPLAAAALLMVFLRRMSWRSLLLLAIPSAAGAIVALLLRRAFSTMFATSPLSYLQLENIPAAFQNLAETLDQMLSSGPGSLKLIMLLGIMLANLALFIYVVASRFRPEIAENITDAEAFIVGFVTASAISLLLGQVITGSVTTRYLLPIVVFPLLTAVLVGIYVLRRLLAGVERADLRRNLSRFLVGVAAVASALVVLVGATEFPSVAAAAQDDANSSVQCYDDFVDGRTVDGVGSFWSVRTLDLYGDGDGVVLQVTEDFHVYRWLVNLESYPGHEFTFVIVDDSGAIPVEALDPLGDPKSVVQCPTFQIYDYEGTPGADFLNEAVTESLQPGFKEEE